PLTEHGRGEAAAAGRWLAAHGPAPALVLCSPALRARQTLAAVLAAFGRELPQRVDARIYEATPGTLVTVADEHAQGAGRVLLVGHNPGLERLLALLGSGQSGDYRGMPTAAVAVLALPAAAALEPGAATLTDFWWP
ncbi:MAG: histidine phosphatase family protein, partial [Pseudoxanthomonas sp.]